MFASIGIGQEEEGRWLAETSICPGRLVAGATREEAIGRAKALSLRVLADRLENGEGGPELGGVFEVLEGTPPNLKDLEAWSQALRRFVESHPKRDIVIDDSRETLYAGRGE